MGFMRLRVSTVNTLPLPAGDAVEPLLLPASTPYAAHFSFVFIILPLFSVLSSYPPF